MRQLYRKWLAGGARGTGNWKLETGNGKREAALLRFGLRRASKRETANGKRWRVVDTLLRWLGAPVPEEN